MNDQTEPDPKAGRAARKSLDEFVDEQLTPDRLNYIWDRLQGIDAPVGSHLTRYKWRDFLEDFWATLKVTRAIHKLAATGALAGLAAIAILLLLPTQLVLQTPARWQNAAAIRLPDQLRFRIGKANASLQDRRFNLAGHLGGLTRGGNAVTAIEVSFTGTNQIGEQILFQGKLVLTNSPGIANVRSQHDILGACLKGELTIGTNQPVHFEQPYSP